jgi:hypothetical protein
MEASSAIASPVLIAEPLDPRLATMIAMTLVVLIFVIPIASALISAFSHSLVIFLGTCLLSAAGFLVSLQPQPAAIPAAIGIQIGGLLLAIGGMQSRSRLAAVWRAIERLPASPRIASPSTAPHEETGWHEETSVRFAGSALPASIRSLSYCHQKAKRFSIASRTSTNLTSA